MQTSEPLPLTEKGATSKTIEGGTRKSIEGASRQVGDDLLDLLAARADDFSEDAMEFILSAIDSGVDERAVRKMIEMDEVELLRVCDDL